MTHRFHTTGRDAWNEPRSPYNDAQRQRAYGPVQPMERPTRRPPAMINRVLMAYLAAFFALCWIMAEVRPYLPEGW